MKIDASSVTLASSHSATASTEVSESLRAWVGDRRPDFEGQERATISSHVAVSLSAFVAFVSDTISIDRVSAAPAGVAGKTQAAGAVDDAADPADNDPVVRLIKLMIEKLTGRKIKVLSYGDMRKLANQIANDVPATQVAPGERQQPAPQVQRAGYGIEYDRHEVHQESEQTYFSADGVVHTADGKDIRFQLDVAMQRSEREESNVSLRAGDAVRKDPLVINFDGTAAQLQNTRFSFDLDSDGKKEDVPLLSGNRGYLALDLNGNGKIDSGSELFGTGSGNGFADLARYDNDHNGWIDENDAVFYKLKAWTPTADGKGNLVSLRDQGVGALYLGNTQTPFELKGDGHAALGGVRSSGVYLKEDGSAGTLQQIDVTV
jgi:hypothetical protein